MFRNQHPHRKIIEDDKAFILAEETMILEMVSIVMSYMAKLKVNGELAEEIKPGQVVHVLQRKESKNV